MTEENKRTNFYIELAKIFKAQEIYANNYHEFNKEWLHAKYFHSLKVVETGIDIINSDAKLSKNDDKTYSEMVDSLLMHDFARSHEKKEDGSTAFRFHGAEGMQMLIENYDMKSPLILASVLLHDQMNRDFLDQNDNDLKESPRYKECLPKTQKNILKLRKDYASLPKDEKEHVDNAIGLVKDADTLANMKDYEIMFPLTKEEKSSEITPKVWDSVKKGDYVNYGDIKTLPDRALAYYAWAFKFSYSSTIKVAFDEKLFDKIKNHVGKEVLEANQNDPEIGKKVENMTKSFDKVIKDIEKRREDMEKTLNKKVLDDVLKRKIHLGGR